MVTGAISKAGGSVGGFKLFPEVSQRVIGPDSGPPIRLNLADFAGANKERRDPLMRLPQCGGLRHRKTRGIRRDGTTRLLMLCQANAGILYGRHEEHCDG